MESERETTRANQRWRAAWEQYQHDPSSDSPKSAFRAGFVACDPSAGRAYSELSAQRYALLKACKAVVEAAGGSKHWNGETEKFLRLCEAAIEKATGEKVSEP